MKTPTLKMLVAFTFITLVGIIACKKEEAAKPFGDIYRINGTATGSMMNPPVTTSPGTAATIVGDYDDSSGILTYTIGWTKLSGTPTNGGIYIGSTVVGDAFTPSSVSSDSLATVIGGTIALTSDQASALKDDQMYFVLGTAANPGGEVRGQIIATLEEAP